MIRVLQVLPNIHRAGIETFIMNVYRNIDRSLIQFDFLVHYNARFDYDDEIESLGGKLNYSEIDPSDGILTNIYTINVKETINKYKNI